jgi:signal transduction histidine kinase
MDPHAELRRRLLDSGTVEALSPTEVIAWLRPVVASLDVEAAGPDLAARAHGYLSGALLQEAQESDAFEHAVWSVRHAEAATLPETRAQAWLAIGNTFFAVGQMAEALRWHTRAAALEGAEATTVFHARTNRAATLRADGRLIDAAEAFDELRAFGAPVSPQRHAAMLINAASCYHQVDRMADARQTLADARDELAALSRADLLAWCDAIEAWIEAGDGTPERTRELAQRVLGDPDQHDTFLRSSAARALAQASVSGAPSLLDEAAEVLHSLHQECRTSSAHQVGLDLSLSLAQVEEARGDLAAAVGAHRAALEHGGRVQRQTRRLDLALDFQRVELARLQVEAETADARREELAEVNRSLAAEAAERQRRLRALAHDVRNPLAAILAAAEFASACDPERRERLWGSVQSAAKRAVAVLDSALQETPDGHRPRGDLGSAAREVLLAFRALAERRGVRITVEGPLSCPVFCGATALGRILDNLVSNALKCSPAGGRVSVKLAAQGDLIELLVLDEGPGFGQDASAGVVLGKQLHVSGDGWGIGLHTVYRLVADHGGSLALTDRPDGGASVKVQFPRAPA